MSLPGLEPATTSGPRRPRRRLRVGPEHAALAAILVLSALLELVKLSQNGWANTFYSAAVKSMLRSWHNFFFVSSDPNGFITVDKPPLALWLQGLSAKVFGFTPLSLLVPEAICGVAAVALLYWIVAPRFGRAAGLLAAFALAVFPSFVAVSRDNGVDPLLILLMLAACGAGLAAIDSGRLRTLIASAVLVGLAFNTKSLAALLCVPGIGLGYLVCAPGSLRRRIAQLAAAGVVLVAVSISWSLAVDLTPAAQRPYVGGSVDNSEFQLEFGYNGFGRVGGQQGGPGTSTTVRFTKPELYPLMRPGVNMPASAAERSYFAAQRGKPAAPKPAAPTPAAPKPTGRQRPTDAIAFGGARSPWRIFGTGLGDQAGWIVPLALIGMLGLLLAVRRRWRDDRRTAGLFVLGGWFLVELAVLDFSAGIVHPYYASALGPGLAAMVGAGAVAIACFVRSDDHRRAMTGFVLAVVAVVSTVAIQLVLIHREDDPLWWRIPLVALCLLALVAIPLLRRRAPWALGVAVVALLVAPMAYSFSVWLAPVDGTFPTAGPYNHAGAGGLDIAHTSAEAFRGLVAYVGTHGASTPYQLFTQSSDQAAPAILLGLRASAEGGYSASDPALSAGGLADLVVAGKARYVLIDGPYSDRGANGAVDAARLVCPELPQYLWAPGLPALDDGSFLVDCAGRAYELRHAAATARAFCTPAAAAERRVRASACALASTDPAFGPRPPGVPPPPR
jgi:4-amino-4-deoxy-L-arabinose transferase-like glycosyltransferase